MPLIDIVRPCTQACQLAFHLALAAPEWLYNVLYATLVWLGLLDSIVLGVPRSAVGELLWASTLRMTTPDPVTQERFAFNPLRSVFPTLAAATGSSPA